MNNQQLAQLRSQSFNDVELICTGKEMKWISLSQSDQRNQFVFVPAPAEVADVDISNLCPSDVVTEPQYLLAIQYKQAMVQFQSYIARVSALAQRPHTAYPYQKALSRAPPILS